MKDYKLKVIEKMNEISKDHHSISLRAAANIVGIKHLKTQECHEILNSFCKNNNEYKIYQLSDNPLDSFFCSAFVSDNETPPVAIKVMQ